MKLRYIFNKRIFILFMFFSVLFLGIGYAQIVNETLSLNGSASALGQEGVIVSGVQYDSCHDMRTDTLTIKTNYQNTFSSKIELGTDVSDPNNLPFMKLMVTVKNLTDKKQVFDAVFYDTNDSQFYSNLNIIPTLSGISEDSTVLNEAGTSGDEISFYITFSYQDISNITDNVLDSIVQFHFTPMSEIEFVGCTNQNGENSQLIRSTSYTTMNGTTYSPNVIISGSPSSISIQNSDGSVTLQEGVDYTYSSGVVTFLNTLTEKYVITASNSGNQFANHIVNLVSDLTPDSNGIYTGEVGDSCTTTLAYDGTADNNLRYVGSSPCNYVNFNCDDTGQNCELWRVIGVMNDVEGSPLVKIVKSDLSYQGIPWNTAVSNNWLTSSLYDSLNGTYYNSLHDLYGKNLIYSAKWNIGGLDRTFTTTNFYEKEHSEQSTSSFNIGLFSPSDYGYATSGGNTARASCISGQLNGSGYTTNCVNNNWFYTKNYYQWTITKVTTSANNQVYIIQTSGKSTYRTVTSASNYDNYRPCVYLKSNVILNGGDGSSSSPYQISG